MTEILLRKELHSLVPVDDDGRSVLHKLSLGDVVKANVRKPRNLQHHRLFFALIGIVFENQERYETRDELLAAIKAATGHATILPMDNGNSIYVPKSISFAKMDQTEFDAFYNKVCDVVCTRIIPNLKQEDLKREVAEMVGA